MTARQAARVVMVDDEEDLIWTLSRQLRRERPQTVFEGYSDPTEALDRIRSAPPDLLVTDLRMPRMSGLDLVGEVRKASPSIPILLITAHGTPDVRREILRRGAIDYLEKPFELPAFLEALDRGLERSEGFSGAISLPMLPDLVQVYALARATGTLRLHESGRKGAIWLEDGEIVHCASGAHEGEEAFYDLMTWRRGDFSMSPGERSDRTTITVRWQELLLEACRRLDESEAAGAPGPTSEERATSSPTNDQPAADDLRPHERPKGAKRVGKIDDACKEVVSSVDGAVACGVVDLDTGMLLGIHNGSAYTQTLNEVVAAATMDLFRGSNIARVEQMVRSHRGIPENGDRYFQEVHVTSANNFHFAKVIKGARAVIMLVTKKTTNIGMGWAQLKSVIPKVEPLVP